MHPYVDTCIKPNLQMKSNEDFRIQKKESLSF